MIKNIMIGLLLFLNFQTIYASKPTEQFIIYGDSQNIKETYKVKKEILEEYSSLVKGLKEDEISKAVKEYFCEDNMSYCNHTLTIIIGDGLGSMIEGDLKTNYCKIEKEDIKSRYFFNIFQ